MRTASSILFLSGMALLSALSLLAGQRLIALGALLVGLGWILPLPLRGQRALRTPLFLSATALSGLALAIALPTLFAVLVFTTALYAWDLAATAERIVAFSGDEQRRFARRYLALATILAGVGIALAGASTLWKMSMAFSPALGLAVGIVLLAVLLVRLAKSVQPETREEDSS